MQIAEERGTRFGPWLRQGVEVPWAALNLTLGALAIGLLIIGGLLLVTASGWTPFERVAAAIESPSMAILVSTAMGLGATSALIGFATYKRMPTKRSREQMIAGAVLGIQALALGGVFMLFRAGNPERFTFHFLDFQALRGYGTSFLNAAKNTVVLAFVGEAGGIVLGLILALLVISDRRTVRAPARAYINFFRGTPLIWQLQIGYFVFLFGFQIRISAYLAAILVFAVNTGAYAAEVFRAGIQSIERGQMEAARSLGMSYMQAMRYSIVPQAVRRVIPPLMNEFVILIKDTSLVVVLGLLPSQLELFTQARAGYSDTANATFFVAAAAGYLAVTLPLIRLVNMIERRLHSGLVGVTG
ncbi:MAG: amino acid ABC transporter permease [Actinomycetota bacterium]